MEHTEEILLKYVDDKLTKKILEPFKEFLLSKSQRDQILIYFKFENFLKNKDLMEIFPDYQVKTLTQRLANSKFIEESDRENKEVIYTLTKEGERYLDKKILSFLEKNYDYKEHLVEKRKDFINSKTNKELLTNIASALFEMNVRPNERDKIIIDMKELAIYSPEISEQIYGDIRFSLDVIKSIYEDDIEGDIADEQVIFTNLHLSEFRDIQDYDREFKGLVFTKGMVTSKKESIVSKTLLFSYQCQNGDCKHHQDYLTSNFALKPNKDKIIICPTCKEQLYLMNEEKINQLESKITNIDTGISFPLFIRGELCSKFSMVELGDEIEVVGYLEDKLIELKNGIKETTKVLVINNFKSTDYVQELTKEETQEVEQVLKNYSEPREYLLKPFEEYIGDNKIKYLFIIQQLTKWDEINKEVPIHIALMGDPGVGKNVLLKTSEEYFPSTDSIVGADITDAGFKGTVNRDTGIKEIGLAKKCQNGTINFNEFDKFVKSNPNGKKAASQLLNASITEQEIKLNKAGIRIRMSNLDLRHNVIFNPLDEKKVENNKIPYDHMGEILDKSLLSRMLPLYISKDIERSKEVFKLQFQKKDKSKKIDPKKYQLVIRYLRAKEVIFTDKAQNVLTDMYNKFIECDKFQAVSVERIGQMIVQLSKGLARLNGKEKCGVSEVKEAHDIYMFCLNSVGVTMENLETLFLDKSIKELKTKKEIKLYIQKQLDETVENELSILELEKLFDKELLNECLYELKQTGDYFEPIKGRFRRLI